jgi:hypothetical protein
MAENSADIAKRIILGCVAEGMTIEQACLSAGKSMKTYEYYRRTDKIFTDKIDRTRLGLKDKVLCLWRCPRHLICRVPPTLP